MIALVTFSQLPIHQVLFGRGLGASSGSFQLENAETLTSTLVHSGGFTTDNFYFTALSEIGIIGLLLFFFVALVYIYLGVKLYRRTEMPFFKSFYAGILFSLNFFLIRNIFLQGTRTTLAGFYFWALIGLMLAAKKINDATESSVETHVHS